MSSNPPEAERPTNPTHFGGEGLYDSSSTEEPSPLKVRLGEHLDSSLERSLQTAERSAASILDLAKRNPLPIVLTVAGLVWLFVSLSRRSVQE